MQRFTTTLRVRHYEMDALGHVNNAVYLHYLEQAAIEHSEQLGFPMERYRQLGGVFILRKLEIDYRRPAAAGDTLTITTWVKEMRGPRAVRLYEIRRSGDDRALVTAEALWAWVDLATQRPRPIPQAVIDAFQTRLKLTDNRAPLSCSRCGTPLELKGKRPLNQHERPSLFGDQPQAKGEQIDVYVCPNCGQSEVFVDNEYSDFDG
ncbi:MAG TPA: thioesterase family protein [Herpetosiphonaceae bacterium]